VVVLTHDHIFKEGHFIEEARHLKGPGKAQLRNLVRLQPPEASASEKNTTLGIGKKTVDAVKQGRLTCPIGPDEAHNLALADIEAHLAKGMEPSKGLGDSLNL
jgi:hypothetical protein